ncbi:hypothetical protein ACMA1I_20140 [Pontibacter sp. 13R65]|uniref:hypothetical protein n=1 Tax=Pontibacter sp. 13R65 TaxID=3127458 RepID=UPI00301C4BC3
MNNNLFLHTLLQLRQQEEIIIFGNMLEITVPEEEEAAAFLTTEFNSECLEYPFTAPEFEKPAALWGARTIYLSAQLLFYRENQVEDLNALLPPYKGKITSASILSADLCLRFLPSILSHLKIIDPDDPLINLLEEHLHNWNFSGVNYSLDNSKLEFATVATDKCLLQLYANRVTAHRNLTLAQHPVFKNLILSNLGIFKDELWKELTY